MDEGSRLMCREWWAPIHLCESGESTNQVVRGGSRRWQVLPVTRKYPKGQKGEHPSRKHHGDGDVR